MKTKNVKDGIGKIEGIRRAALAGVIGILMISVLAAMAVPTVLGAGIYVHTFYGNVTVNGEPAPNGTVVTGRIVDALGSPGEGNVTVTKEGIYAGSGAFDPKLKIQTDNDHDCGKTIEFFVKRPSDTEEIKADQTATYENMGIDILDLTAATVKYNLTISSTDGGNVTDPGEGTFTRSAGAVVNLKAVQDAGYAFVNWTGEVSTIADVNAPETNITMDDNYTIVANFEPVPIRYNLTIASTEGGSVTVPGEGTYTYNANEEVELKAVADAGYGFVNWTGEVSTIADVNAPETNITMDDNYTIMANFEVIPVKNGSVAGRITYTCNGMGIADVTVNLTQGGSVVNSTTTNGTGHYDLANVPQGNYYVNASKIRFWDNSTAVTVTAGNTTEADMMLWLKGDLDGNCTVADADDLRLMIRACLRIDPGDWRYDLNGNGRNGDIGDLVLLKRASLGEIVL